MFVTEYDICLFLEAPSVDSNNNTQLFLILMFVAVHYIRLGLV